MLEALRFVNGAVSKKEIIEGLSHFKICKGAITAYNGVIALSSPIALDFDCVPKAELMLKAILNCNETVQLSLTSSGRLGIKSGGFSAYIPCLNEETPHVSPEGEVVELQTEELFEAMRLLSPIIGTDAFRPFCTTMRLKGPCIYVTNNMIAVEYYTGVNVPIPMSIPSVAIRELLRIKEKPTHMQYTEKSVTFHYNTGRWLRTALTEDTWPDVAKAIDKLPTEGLKLLDKSIAEAGEKLKPFTDNQGRVYIENGVMRTHYEITEGASNIIQDMSIHGVYQIDSLMLLNNIAKTIDLTCYPEVSLFRNDKLRGMLIGIRL